jgi:hypothetical protein
MVTMVDSDLAAVADSFRAEEREKQRRALAYFLLSDEARSPLPRPSMTSRPLTWVAAALGVGFAVGYFLRSGLERSLR